MLDWRDKRSWHLAGIVLTAIWLTGIALKTGGDPAHPLFRYIFIVPLVGWLLLLGLQHWLDRRHGSDRERGDDI